MTRLYVDNFSTTLAESVASGDTSFDLVDASGLGTIGGGDYVTCTIDNGTTLEIIHVTARTSNTITCTRAQEGTSAGTWAGTELIEARLTADGMDEKLNVADAVTGALRFISSATASASSALTFTGLGNYSQIRFVLVDLKPATDNVRLYLRTSTNNGSSYDSGAGNYSYVFQGGTTAPADASTTGSSSATEIHLCTGVGNDTNEWVSGEVIVYNPTGTAYTVVHANMLPIGATGVLSNIHGGGMRISAADVDAVQFLFASGNITSGTIYAYGLSKT